MATRKGHFGWPGELFWLARGNVLVGQGSQIEANQNLPDVRFLDIRFLDIRFLFLSFANTTLSLRLPMRFGNIVRVKTSRYLIKITTPVAKVLTAKHTASLQLLCTVSGNQARLDARTEFKILEPSPKGGVEAGRAHYCSSLVSWPP